MKLTHLALVVLLSAATAFGVVKVAAPTGTTAATPAKETAFERVMRTNTLRCGYYSYPPVTIKDPTTGKMSGMAIDIMEGIAAKTGIKIEWTEEITFGTWIAALQAGRFDAVCTPLWGDASYSRAVRMTRPLFYDIALPLVRANETRFSSNAEDLNRPDVTIAVQESNMSESVVRALFPTAKVLPLPAATEYGLILQNVVAGKADMAIWSLSGFALYSKTNPDTLKILELSKPLKIIPCELPVLGNEDRLHAFLNAGIEDLLLSGDLDRILRKWETQPGKTFLRVAHPYEPRTMQKDIQ